LYFALDHSRDRDANVSAVAPFTDLNPDLILTAVEQFGGRCDGHLQALNSFENRVYLVGMENAPRVVAKFYRPGRYTDEMILEEHEFLAELAQAEISVAAPIADSAGSTLINHAGYRVAIFPQLVGRTPELNNDEDFVWLGRTLARIHAIGELRPFAHRETLDINLAARAVQACLTGPLLPADLHSSWQAVAGKLLPMIADSLTDQPFRKIRLHGDFHIGNVLWSAHGPACVDFDDARMGPAVQDLWLCLPSQASDDPLIEPLLVGYRQFRDFELSELRLINALRLLRRIHFAGWLSARWDDPAFPVNFAFAASPSYWRQLIDDLNSETT
jgi:Ser/Thr protein kinase RdoA (MazF antagonist)